MSKWFRWHTGSCEDGKFRVTARNAGVTVATVMGVWAALLEDASDDRHRGIAKHDIDYHSAILDLTCADLADIWQAMESIGLISVSPEGIAITKWNYRQFESDNGDGTNAERQRRWRQKRKANGGETVVTAERNGTVTATENREQNTDNTPSLRSGGAPDGAEGKRPAKERKRRSQLPELWQPDERDVIYAHSRGFFGEKVYILAAAFSNHHRGRGNVMADWHAAWRTWCDNEIKFHGGKNVGRKTVQDAAREQHERILAQIAAFDEPAPSGLCDGTSPDVIRLLPARGCE